MSEIYPTSAASVPRVTPFLMLIARTFLFALTQTLIAILFFIQGEPNPWQVSIAWWPICAIVTNFICLALLAWLARQEGSNLADLYNFDRSRFGRDLLMGFAFIFIAFPFAYLGLVGSTWLLYGGTMPDFFFPLPMWAAVLTLLLFAPTVALAELPTYMGYCLPRIEAITGKSWLALLLATFWLAAQHAALPLIFDWKFVLWRFSAFLPLAFIVGLLYLRTRRLIPLMVAHGLIDASIGWTVFSLSSM